MKGVRWSFTFESVRQKETTICLTDENFNGRKSASVKRLLYAGRWLKQAQYMYVEENETTSWKKWNGEHLYNGDTILFV